MPNAAFKAIGTPGSNTANLTLTPPSHDTFDVLVAVIECSESVGVAAPATQFGWVHAGSSPRAQGSNVTTINVFWKRASAPTTPAVTFTDPGNHMIGVIYAVEDAITYGDPWDGNLVGSGANNTSINATGITPSAVNALIAIHIGNQADTLTDQFSSMAAAGLTGFTEREQQFTDSGNGGGIGVWTGTRAAATATGNITGTQPSNAWTALVGAFKNDLGTAYAGPKVRGIGTPNSGTTGSVTATLPTHVAGDLLLLAVECDRTVGVTAPSGWASVTGSPIAGGTNITSLSLFWKRASSNAETDPTPGTTADHAFVQAFSIRDAAQTGDPWNITPATGGDQSATSFSLAGGTTTEDDCLVLTFISNNIDTASDQFVNVQDSDLEYFQEVSQEFTTTGNGGGIAVYSGEKTTAGTIGTIKGTMPSASYGAVTLALLPYVPSTVETLVPGAIPI